MVRRLLPTSEEGILAYLRAPPPGVEQSIVVTEAIMFGRADLVRRAVEEGVVSVDVEVRALPGAPKITLLHLATMFGSMPLLRFLILERRADPNTKCPDNGASALHIAAAQRNESAALFLIREAPSIDVNIRRLCGTTPLMVAAQEGLVRVVKALVAKGAAVDMRDEDGKTAMDRAAWNGKEETAIYLLEETGASWQVPGGWGVLLLSRSGDVNRSLLRAILRRMRVDGLDEAVVTFQMGEAAAGAVARGIIPMLQALMEEGLDPTRPVGIHRGNKPDLAGLLEVACDSGNQEAAVFLMEHGCDPLESCRFGWMPHHAAARRGRLPLLRWLFDRTPGVHVNTEAVGLNAGATALHFAAEGGHMHLVKWLIGKGANVLQLGGGWDGGPRLASDVADKKGHPAVAAYLREQEEIAEAAAEAEQEAAARRVRNDKRRQKQKKAKARKRAAAGGGGGGGEEAEEEDQQQDEGKKEEAQGEQKRVEAAGGDDLDGILEAALAGLGMPSMEGGGSAGGVDVEGEQEESRSVAARAAAAAATAAAVAAADDAGAEQEKEGKQAALAAAIALSPSVERPPPLEEYLDAHAPDDLICPITMTLLADPVTLVADGCTYSRVAIEQHFAFCRQRKAVVIGGREFLSMRYTHHNLPFTTTTTTTPPQKAASP
jgi:ankyrin repeat protein